MLVVSSGNFSRDLAVKTFCRMKCYARMVALSGFFMFAPTNNSIAQESPPPTTDDEVNAAPTAPVKRFTPSEADLADTTIGNVVIVVKNVFDLDLPSENKSLYRFANKIHIVTRPSVIESQLLFKSGDPYDKRLLDETERLLRRNVYLASADIKATKVDGGVVDLEVRTADVWSLSPSLRFSRGGGENSAGIGLKEYNLFGYGTRIAAAVRTNVDRDSFLLQLSDRNLFGSRNQIVINYADNSDGHQYRFNLVKPFYSLNSTRSNGIMLGNGLSIESVYELGEIESQYELEAEVYEAFLGWSAGLRNGWARRYTAGLIYSEHRFSDVPDDLLPLSPLPPDRLYVFPFVGIELAEDHFVEGENIDQIGRVEDRHLGMRFSAKLGYASESFGSSSNSWQLQSYLSKSLYNSDAATLLLSGSLIGRLENGDAENAQLALATRYDYRQSEKRLLHFRFAGTAGRNLDLDNPVYLGGDNGLRGYPLRYQRGDSSFLFTVEQRYFTDWYPFRLFRVGGAIFFDAGRTWASAGQGSEQLGWLKDVGVGLRIANTRLGSANMFHIDVAFPLDGGDDIDSMQILVRAKRRF